jgi:hypothetical protein
LSELIKILSPAQILKLPLGVITGAVGTGLTVTVTGSDEVIYNHCYLATTETVLVTLIE